MSSARSLYRQYSSTTSSSSENLPPRTLARVARELRNLHKSPPEGVRLIVDGETTTTSESQSSSSSSLSTSAAAAAAAATATTTNLEQILCEMQGPTETPYEGRFFVLKLAFTSDFPAAPPRGYFVTKLYHPNVDPQTGAICVNTLKKDWTAETTLAHVLAVIRCLLIVPFPESSLNDEAGKLFMESYHEYAKRAKLMAQVHGRTYNVLGHSAATTSVDSSSSEGTSEEPLSTSIKNHTNTTTHASTTTDGTDPLAIVVDGGDQNTDCSPKSSHSASKLSYNNNNTDTNSTNTNTTSSSTTTLNNPPLRNSDNHYKKKTSSNLSKSSGTGNGATKLHKKKSLKRL